MTLEGAFGPNAIICRNVLITRVSSASEMIGKDYVQCTYDYIELDNGQTIRNLKVRRSFYELIDENFRTQTRTDLYINNGELHGGLRSDGKMMLDAAYTRSLMHPILFVGLAFFLGVFLFGLILIAEGISDNEFWGLLGGLCVAGIGGYVLLEFTRGIRWKLKTRPFFLKLRSDNEQQYRARMAKVRSPGQ